MNANSLAFVGLHSVFWQATERWLSLTLSAALIPIVLAWLSKARSEPSPEGHRTMSLPRAYGYVRTATLVWRSRPRAGP